MREKIEALRDNLNYTIANLIAKEHGEYAEGRLQAFSIMLDELNEILNEKKTKI